ncbi:MAG: hypothetical protein WBI40_10020 [Methylococcaceae bacterium]
MSNVMLYPPLEQIENSLFGLSDQMLQKLAEKDAALSKTIREAALSDKFTAQQVADFSEILAEPLDAITSFDSVEIPDFLEKLIDAKVATQQTDFGKYPQSGQLIVINQLNTPKGEIADLHFSQQPLILLDLQDPQTKVWHGFMVASEVQYAGFWDALLEPQDEPFDPACGMVQIWNPVKISLPDNQPIKALGKLSPLRMQAIRALSAEYLLGELEMPATKIGYIASRPTFYGFTVVTGTPLKNDDPRRVYQQLYHHTGDLVNAPVREWLAQAQTAESPSWLTALTKQITQTWQDLKGQVPIVSDHSVGVLGYAMSSSESSDKEKHILLQDDLCLSIFCDDDSEFRIQLDYSGNDFVKVAVIDEGRKVQDMTLQTGQKTPLCTGLERDEDNRLELTFANDQTLSIPLSVD